MSDNKPWEVEGMFYNTQAKFEYWVQGQIRKGMSRHPVRSLYIKSKRFRKDNGRGRMTWHCVCEICDNDYPQAKTQVDHLEPCTLKGIRTEAAVGNFIHRTYYITFDDIQILCRPCHNIKTYSERYNITFEEAVIEKQVVEVMKKSAYGLKAWLKIRNEEYLTPKPKNRDTVRRLLNDSIN